MCTLLPTTKNHVLIWLKSVKWPNKCTLLLVFFKRARKFKNPKQGIGWNKKFLNFRFRFTRWKDRWGFQTIEAIEFNLDVVLTIPLGVVMGRTLSTKHVQKVRSSFSGFSWCLAILSWTLFEVGIFLPGFGVSKFHFYF